MVPHGLGKAGDPADRAPCGKAQRAPEPLVRCVHAQGWSAQLREALGGLALPCGACYLG